MLLIDKTTESCQNSKKIERNAIPTTKKKLLKRKGNSITSAKANVPISQTSSERLKLTVQEEVSKASLPVSAELSNDFKSIILETDQRKIYPS